MLHATMDPYQSLIMRQVLLRISIKEGHMNTFDFCRIHTSMGYYKKILDQLYIAIVSIILFWIFSQTLFGRA